MADPFDTIVDSSLAKDAYGSVYSAQYGDAIKSAKANELAKRLNLPPEIVESDYPNMMAEDRLRTRIEETRRNSAYARIMANPRLAAAAIDDDELPKVASKLGQHVQSRSPRFRDRVAEYGYAGALARSLRDTVASAGNQAGIGLGGLVRAAGDAVATNTPEFHNPFSAAGQRQFIAGLRKKPDNILTRAGEGITSYYRGSNEQTAVQYDNWYGNQAARGFESIPLSVVALVAAARGKPKEALTMMGGVTGGAEYDEARREGLDPVSALQYGAIQGGLEAAGESLPLTRFIADAGKGFFKAVGGQLVAENIGEQFTGHLQDFNRWVSIEANKGKSFQEFALERPEAALSIALATTAATGLQTGAAYGLERMASKFDQKARDTRDVLAIDSMMDDAANSPTRTANPTQFSEALNQLVGDTAAENLYVPAEQIQALFQSEDGTTKDVSADPFWGKYAQQLQEAAALGGDVIVPLADIATHLAGTPQWQALRDYVRTSPQGASISEAKAKQTPEELDRLAGDIAGRLEKQVRSIAQRESMKVVDKFAEGMGYKGEQAKAINYYLARWLSVQHPAEVAKRLAAGETPPTLEEFAAAKLPDKAKMAQADYDAAQADLIDNPAREAAQNPAAYEQIKTYFQSEPQQRLAAGSATLDGGNSNSFYMMVRGSRDEQTSTSPDAISGQAVEPGQPATEGIGAGPPQATQGSEEQLEFFPGADLGTDPAFFGSEIEVDGEMRPTVNSDGQPIAQNRQAIENFWRWFGDSKAIDRDGQPILFYHGARAQFDIFGGEGRNTFFFAKDRGTAEAFQQDGGQFVQAYLRITNEEHYDAGGNMWDHVIEGEYEQWQIDDARTEYVADQMQSWTGTGEVVPVNGVWEVRHDDAGTETFENETDALDRLTELQDEERDTEEQRIRDETEWYDLESEEYLTREGIDLSTDMLAAQAMQEGKDAVWIDDVDEGSGATTVVIVLGDPTAIKSSENRGGFDPANPSMFNQGELSDGARGNISISRDEAGFMSASLVRAFESANFSTAIHELGHFFLEDLRTRALRGDATDSERADWQAFKDWAGEQGQPIDDGKTIPVEAHEYFARGMERYVWEGQAPSKGLRALFARMREFMLELYRTATAFNAPLTPEIREVMDRMLASDAEIEEQRAEMKVAAAAVGDLMTPDEKREYDLLADEARLDAKDKLFERILSALRAEKRAEFNERKREIKAEAEEAIDGQPIMQALKLLRTGIKDADGNTNNVRLSREWLMDTYGEDIVGQMPKGVPPIIGDTDTMDADQIAEMTGYSSGDAMVKDLIEHEAQRQEMKAGGDKRSPRTKAIADIVDARIRDEIGDPYADLEEEAKAALASDKQADVMSMELRAIARRTGGRPTPWKLAVDWARDRVSTQTAKEALSGTMLQMYARNAGKAGQAVEEALIKGDYADAFQAKQRQMLNMALLSEARKAKETVDKAVRRMQKIAGKTTIRSVDQDYLDQAHQLLEDVDMKIRPQSRIDKRLAFEAWHGNQVALGLEPVVPAEYRSLLGRVNWTRLPIDELLELDQTVAQIVELGRLKQKLRDNKAERDYEEGVAEAEAVADTVADRAKSPTTDDRKSIMGLLRSKLRSADAAMLTAERVMSWMDNGDPNGPWTRLIYNVMSEAQGNEKDLTRDYVGQLNELIRSLDPKLVRGWDRKVDTPELLIRTREHSRSGEVWSGTKDQIVMMAMNWGNAGNRQRLLDGFGWDEAAMEVVLERHMTKADWDFVQSTWDIVDTLWPQIEAMERRVNGVAPEKVEASEVNTPFGVYRGGYFPAVYDPNESSAASINEEDKQSPQGGWHKATTRASASKARAAMVKGRPMMLSLDVVTRHMGEVIHDVTHREAVHQVRKLMTDKRIRSAINRKLGPEYARALGSWIDNIAQPGIAYSKAAPWTVAVGRYLHKAISLVGLGFRVSTVLLQPLGSLPAIGEIGAKNVGHGYRVFVANPAKAMREIHKRSAFMRARADNFDASIEQMRAAASGGLLKKMGFPTPIITEIGERGLSKYAFQGIAYADMMVSGSAWIGAFDKSTAEGMTEDEAALYADSVVRKTQGAGGTADTSLLMNEHPLIRSFYPFFSYLNALYGMQRDIGRRAATAETAGDYADSMRRLWWVAVAPIIAQSILFGEGPDEEDEEGWTAYIGKSLVMGNLAAIPGVGAISAAMGNGYGYRASAIQSVGEGVVKAKDDAWKAYEEGEDYEPTGSVIKRTMTTLGLIAAKPLGQIGTTAGGVYDYSTGEADPEDAGDFYELLTKGKVSDNPRPIEQMMGEEA